MTYAPGTNTGHGHVWPRPDGVKARCGGPGLCKECSADQAAMDQSLTGRVDALRTNAEHDPLRYAAHVAEAMVFADMIEQIMQPKVSKSAYTMALTIALANAVKEHAKDRDDALLGTEALITGIRRLVLAKYDQPEKKAG